MNFDPVLAGAQRLVDEGATPACQVAVARDHEIEQFYRRGTMSDALLGLRNGVQTALAIHRAASDDKVSRGCHYRTDGPSA